ncbi:MAG: hypothetical protein FD127_1849 [Acidimicrobiaceae bacterium]|nr:MAG: hypothetical protein FD127_1849 [Acidimicrobiaceae bacterium]
MIHLPDGGPGFGFGLVDLAATYDVILNFELSSAALGRPDHRGAHRPGSDLGEGLPAGGGSCLPPACKPTGGTLP